MFTVSDPRKIGHMPMSHVNDVEQLLRGDVLEAALKNFGYSADSFNAVGPLARALSDLDISPLRTHEVEQYMESKRTVRTIDPRRVMQPAINGVLLLVSVCTWLFLRHMAPQWPCLQNTHIEGPNTIEYFYFTFPVIIATVIMALVINLGFFLEWEPSKIRISHDWEQYSLGPSAGGRDHYPRYVPLHVLNLANQIVETCSDAEFVVYELTRSIMRVPAPVRDPFLLVQRGSERYYIAVWDEREFEAKQ